jgi:hypothetical protein
MTLRSGDAACQDGVLPTGPPDPGERRPPARGRGGVAMTRVPAQQPRRGAAVRNRDIGFWRDVMSDESIAQRIFDLNGGEALNALIQQVNGYLAPGYEISEYVV